MREAVAINALADDEGGAGHGQQMIRGERCKALAGKGKSTE